MKITKLGHCCLIVEHNGVRIMTDPGEWTQAQNDIKDINLILITHEHADHFHADSIKQVLKNNPEAKIVTNTAVGNLLKQQNVSYEILEHEQTLIFRQIVIEGYGSEHATIFGSFGKVQNTGYFIDNKFFYPGDSFFVPNRQVDVLALPVCGPWMKISEAIEYVKLLRPRVSFPVHDGMLKITGPFHYVPMKLLANYGLMFKILEIGKPTEL